MPNEAQKADDECIFIDDKDRIVFLSQGIGDIEWGSFHRKHTGSLCRIKSPALPMRPTRDEAERDLTGYASKKGWKKAHMEVI